METNKQTKIKKECNQIKGRYTERTNNYLEKLHYSEASF